MNRTMRRSRQRLAESRHLETLEPRSLLTGVVPLLASLPDAPHTIYLDFDGQEVHSNDPRAIPVIHAPPFDLDGTKYDETGAPTFSPEEQEQIRLIWERVTEDFRPFNVNITTVDPSVETPDVFTQGGLAQRVLFTSKWDEGPGGTGARWFLSSSNGWATTEAWYTPADNPTWVFSTHPVGAAEIASHEIGHSMGLLHDGDASQSGIAREYRGPHGSGETRWSPIMGQGNVLTQWSKGEYPFATNVEHDFGLLAVALGRRPDDFIGIAELELAADGSVFTEGIIGAEGDTDTFRFVITEPDTQVSLEVQPWHNGPNLDVGLGLQGLTTGRIFNFSNTDVNPHDRLAASFDLSLQPGTYFLIVDGVGKPAIPGDPGYTDYGSLGYYRITGSIGTTHLSVTGDVNGDAVADSQDIDALYALMASGASAENEPAANLHPDGVLDQRDVDVLVRNVMSTEYGDFNLDGAVDFADFLLLSSNFGKQQTGWTEGDANGNRAVDFADFLLLSSYFGTERDD